MRAESDAGVLRECSAVCVQGYDSASIQAKAKALTMELLLSKTLLSQ